MLGMDNSLPAPKKSIGDVVRSRITLCNAILLAVGRYSGSSAVRRELGLASQLRLSACTQMPSTCTCLPS